jgi:hypothetical protein
MPIWHVLRRPAITALLVTAEGDMKVLEVDAQTWEISGDTFVRAFPRVLEITDDG